jgi:hypothetical protein
MLRSLAIPLMLSAALPAFAGEPLVTDDASVLDEGVCQLEAWHRWSTNGGHEGWGVPACSVHPDVELGVGFARRRDDEVGSHTLFALRAKTVLFRAADDAWSAGFVAIGLHDGARETRPNGFHEAAALALATFNLLDHRLRIHANAGVVYSQNEYTTGAWGLAGEYDFADDWTLLGEVYRDGPGRPGYQVGVRYTLVTDRVELFLSGGDRFGHHEEKQWFAKFGVRFESWKLF